jgi:hypothetical protein
MFSDLHNDVLLGHPGERVNRWVQAVYMLKMQKNFAQQPLFIRLLRTIFFKSYWERRERRKICQFLGYTSMYNPISPLDQHVLYEIIQRDIYGHYIAFLHDRESITVQDMLILMRQIGINNKHEELMKLIKEKAYSRKRNSEIRPV